MAKILTFLADMSCHFLHKPDPHRRNVCVCVCVCVCVYSVLCAHCYTSSLETGSVNL